MRRREDRRPRPADSRCTGAVRGDEQGRGPFRRGTLPPAHHVWLLVFLSFPPLFGLVLEAYVN